MKRLIPAVIVLGVALACHAQGPVVHGHGDPTTQSPTPNCAFSRFYVDDSTGTMWQANIGSPCTWSQAGTSADATARAAAAAAQATANGALPMAGGTVTGAFNALKIAGFGYADQRGSIAAALSAGDTSIAAPPGYTSTDMPVWTRANFASFGMQQSSIATSSPVYLTDQRSGGAFNTVINPFANTYPSVSNPYIAYQDKADFTGVPATTQAPNQGYFGGESVVLQTQGGVLSQLYDFVHQSKLVNHNFLSVRNTSEATEALAQNVYCTAPGDCVADNTAVFGPAGAGHPFDEGMELWSHVVSSTINVYRGTLTGSPTTGSLALVVSPASPGGGSGELIAGTQGENRWMIDTQSGKVTALTATALTGDVQPFSDASTNCQGGSCNYFTQVTPTASVTASTAWGSLTSAVTVPGSAVTPGVETISVSLASGTLTTGLACVADEAGNGKQHLGNYETINISATNGTTSVTATFDKSHPVSGTIWQGWGCGSFAEIVGSDLASGSAWSNGESAGTTTYPVRDVWPVLGSVDGTNIILWTGRDGYNVVDAAWSAQSNKSINLYQGSEVYKVVGANNDTTDNHFALAPNAAAWASGDTVEESQFPYQAANAGNISLSTWLPHDGGCRLCLNLLGRVENNDYGIDVQNSAAASNYSNSGGTWAVPQAAYGVLGSWQSALLVSSVTVNSVIGLPCGAGVNCGSLQRIVNPGSLNTTDYFGYTNTSGRTASGGLWSFSGNASVSGTLSVGGGSTTTTGFGVSGGSSFTTVPANYVGLGTINSTTGWTGGTGVIFGSPAATNNAFSVLWNGATAYFGNLTNSSSARWMTLTASLATFLGAVQSTTSTLTAATPTVAATQIGVGTTTAAATSCGSLASAAGCWAINVAGTVHYIPYY